MIDLLQDVAIVVLAVSNVVVSCRVRKLERDRIYVNPWGDANRGAPSNSQSIGQAFEVLNR